ncbi:MAG TPA: glycine cleavage system aminomethyltransferase GcvT [Candidatus Acidoferrales bacterium]|nr:glycine cleavage system aminomethyltransferase GcvT [Candidatus Acidoferrales bacterium]
MLKTTQFYRYHLQHSKLTEFAGYEMPLWYTTTTEEHLAVRNDSGIFDVSHMGRFIVRGESAASFLEGLVPTRVQKQPVGRAFYTLFLSDRAGIIDDLVILRLRETEFMLVVNAANAEEDMKHIKSHGPPESVEVEDATGASAMVAVQGPTAQEALQQFTDLDLNQLKRFRCSQTKVLGQVSIISRTGYTGEDGFEVIILGASNDKPGRATDFWDRLALISRPCGLGARDSLRLEAGFPLHGLDISRQTDPLQADLAWVLSPDKTGYVGSKAVSDLRAKTLEVIRRGVILNQGIPRHGFEVLSGSGSIGKVTSGTFSPIIRKGIALCSLRLEGTEPGTKVSIAVRDSAQEGQTVKPPFYDELLYGWKRQGNGN